MAHLLHPLDQPIAIFPQFIAPSLPTTMLMKSSSNWKFSYDVNLTGTSVSIVVSDCPRSPANETHTQDVSSADPAPDPDPDPGSQPSRSCRTESSRPVLQENLDLQGIPKQPNILRVEGESLSVSHRLHVYDGNTNAQLCTIRRENLSFRSKYYAESSKDNSRLFESESRASWGRKNVFSFKNQAGDSENIELSIKSSAFSQTQEIYRGNRLVGLIEVEPWHTRTHYNLTATQGLDVFIVVCIAALVDDQRSSRHSRATANNAGFLNTGSIGAASAGC